ncbi:hypothetical protein D3C84_1177260 [compost metagenome]
MRVVRLSRRTPMRASRRAMLLPTAERVRPKVAAAAVKLPAFAALTKAAMSPKRLGSMGAS